MATGKVKWFNDQKGFGFISSEQNRDVFVHHSVIEGDGYKTLEDGETVEYEAEDGPKGLKALKVRRTVTSNASTEPPDTSIPGNPPSRRRWVSYCPTVPGPFAPPVPAARWGAIHPFNLTTAPASTSSDTP